MNHELQLIRAAKEDTHIPGYSKLTLYEGETIGMYCVERSHLIFLSISSVYSPFSDRVGLPLHKIPSSGVLMKSIGAEFLLPDALPDVNHIRGMQYQIVLNIELCPKLN